MNADDPLDAVMAAWRVADMGDITERVMERIEQDALRAEIRQLHASMREALREIAALRAEMAALRGNERPGAATRGQRLLPFVAPGDVPRLLG
jgi:hypothetical protein